jgi:uncharacterized iron-regulated membrane protein
MRDLLLKLHLYIGLAASVFLILLGISGAVIAFEDDLNRTLNPEMLRVQPSGERLSWDAIQERVEQQEPGWKVVRYYFPQHATDSLYIRLRSLHTKQIKHMYVNQYTGAVLGDAGVGNRFTLFMHDLHVNLARGKAGSKIVVVSTVALLLLSITGILLWWPRKIFRFTPGSSLPRLNNDLHRSLGFWTSLAMFMFSVTGLLLHYQSGGKLLEMMNANAVEVNAPAAGTSINSLVEAAEKAAPGAAVIRVMLPEKKGDDILVQARYPEDHTPAGRTYMNLDARTGAVRTITSSRTAPVWLTALVVYVRELHTGTILGTPTRVLMAILSLLMCVLAFTGPMIWLNKKLAINKGRRARRARSSEILAASGQSRG